MTKVINEGQFSSSQTTLYDKFRSIYDQLKINNQIPLNPTNEEQLKRLLGDKLSDLELDQFLLFIILHEKNNDLEEKLLKKDHSLKELFRRITFAKRDIAKNTIESQLQLLFSYMLGQQVLEFYDGPSKVREYFHSLFKETENQLRLLQKDSLELYPVSLEELGVIPSIKSYYKHRRTHTPSYIDVSFLGSLKRYDSETEIMIYRYLQQLMDTIDRDTEATELTIQFLEENTGQITCIFKGNAGHTDLSKHKDFIMFCEVINSFSGKVEQETSADSFEIKFSIKSNSLSE